MPGVSEIAEKLNQCRNLEKELAAEIRKAETVAKGECKLAATPWMRCVALKVFAIAKFDSQAAIVYLQGKNRSADASDIEKWHAELKPDEREALARRPDGPSPGLRQWLEADKFVRELGVVSWIKQMNRNKSVAPTPGAVLRQAASTTRLPPKRNSRHRWLQRLMSRWGCRKGRFASGARLTPEAFEEKARGCAF
jgi:hypothetical protein